MKNKIIIFLVYNLSHGMFNFDREFNLCMYNTQICESMYDFDTTLSLFIASMYG